MYLYLQEDLEDVQELVKTEEGRLKFSKELGRFVLLIFFLICHVFFSDISSNTE